MLAQVSPERRIAQLEMKHAAVLAELEALQKRIARAEEHVRRELEADQNERADMHRAGMVDGLGMAGRWIEDALGRVKGGAS